MKPWEGRGNWGSLEAQEGGSGWRDIRCCTQYFELQSKSVLIMGTANSLPLTRGSAGETGVSYMLVIPAPGRLRQEDLEFQTRCGFRARSCLKNTFE